MFTRLAAKKIERERLKMKYLPDKIFTQKRIGRKDIKRENFFNIEDKIFCAFLY